MKSERGTVTVSIILFVAGTLMTIVFFVMVVWPWMLSIWYGSCWSDARSDLKGLATEIESGVRYPGSEINYRVSFGDCIAGVVFVNGKDDPSFSKLLADRCSSYDGYKSYMLVIPREYPLSMNPNSLPTELYESIKDKLKSLKDSISVWEAIKLWVKDKVGKIPNTYCYEFEHAFTISTLDSDKIISLPEGFKDNWLNQAYWNTGKDPYCIKVSCTPTSDGGCNYLISPYTTCPATKDTGSGAY
jgi:hypothetical protein